MAEQMLAALGVPMAQMAEAIKALAADRAAGSGGRAQCRVLDVRDEQWPQFSGSGFEDWACALKRGLRALGPMAYDLLAKAEAMGTCDMEDMAIEFPDTDIQRYLSEIYDIMCQSVSGEPLQVVRSVDDMDGVAGMAPAGQKMLPQVLG